MNFLKKIFIPAAIVIVVLVGYFAFHTTPEYYISVPDTSPDIYVRSPGERTHNLKVGDYMYTDVSPHVRYNVSDAGPEVTFTLTKPDGSSTQIKSKLNTFVASPCLPGGTCPSGWSAGMRLILGYATLAGTYTISSSNTHIHPITFEVKQ